MAQTGKRVGVSISCQSVSIFLSLCKHLWFQQLFSYYSQRAEIALTIEPDKRYNFFDFISPEDLEEGKKIVRFLEEILPSKCGRYEGSYISYTFSFEITHLNSFFSEGFSPKVNLLTLSTDSDFQYSSSSSSSSSFTFDTKVLILEYVFSNSDDFLKFPSFEEVARLWRLFPQVEDLKLKNCHIPHIQAFVPCHYLSVLKAENCSFGNLASFSEDPTSISEEGIKKKDEAKSPKVLTFSEMHSLTLANCRFSEAVLYALLHATPQLDYLHISDACCPFNPPNHPDLPVSIPTLPQLRMAHFERVDFSTLTLSFPPFLLKCPHLTYLGLQNCNLGMLSEAIGALKSLRILDLSNDFPSTPNANRLQLLSGAITALTHLEMLNIENNLFERHPFLPDHPWRQRILWTSLFIMNPTWAYETIEKKRKHENAESLNPTTSARINAREVYSQFLATPLSYSEVRQTLTAAHQTPHNSHDSQNSHDPQVILHAWRTFLSHHSPANRNMVWLPFSSALLHEFALYDIEGAERIVGMSNSGDYITHVSLDDFPADAAHLCPERPIVVAGIHNPYRTYVGFTGEDFHYITIENGSYDQKHWAFLAPLCRRALSVAPWRVIYPDTNLEIIRDLEINKLQPNPAMEFDASRQPNSFEEVYRNTMETLMALYQTSPLDLIYKYIAHKANPKQDLSLTSIEMDRLRWELSPQEVEFLAQKVPSTDPVLSHYRTERYSISIDKSKKNQLKWNLSLL